MARRESDSGQNLGSAACQLPLALPGDRRRIPAPERLAASSNSRKRPSRVRVVDRDESGPPFSSPTPTAIDSSRLPSTALQGPAARCRSWTKELDLRLKR